MQKIDAEKLAAHFAAAAVATTKAQASEALGLVKAASGVGDFMASPSANYLLGGLGGVGAGALMGALQPEAEKRKRNMLYYGGMGGLAGLGAAHLYNNINKAQTAQSVSAPTAADPATSGTAPVPPSGGNPAIDALGKKLNIGSTGTNDRGQAAPNEPVTVSGRYSPPLRPEPLAVGVNGPESVAQQPLRPNLLGADIGSDRSIGDEKNWVIDPNHWRLLDWQRLNPVFHWKGRDKFYAERLGRRQRAYDEKAKALMASMLDMPPGEPMPTQEHMQAQIRKLLGPAPARPEHPLAQYAGKEIIRDGKFIPEVIKQIKTDRSRLHTPVIRNNDEIYGP